ARVAGQVFNVGCAQSVSINDLWDRIQTLTGVPVLPKRGEGRPGEITNSLASIDKARELVGYEPSVDFDEGLRQTVAYYRARRRDVVAEPPRQERHGTAHRFLVFDHQNRQPLPPLPGGGLRRHVGAAGIHGELERKPRSPLAAFDILHPHPPAHAPNQAEGDREAEAGAVLRLGREERLEHAVEDLGRYAGTRVVDRHQHVVVTRSRGDGDLAGATRGFDRLSGVDDGVEHDLLELLWVAGDGGDVLRDGNGRADARLLECAG